MIPELFFYVPTPRRHFGPMHQPHSIRITTQKTMNVSKLQKSDIADTHQKKVSPFPPSHHFSQYLVLNLNQAPQLRVLIALVPSFSDKMLEFNN